MSTSKIFTHFIAAVIITGIMFTIHVCVQQSYRTAANDPQLQLARDIKTRLEKNETVENLLPADTIELAQSLGVFVELFDKNKQPLQTTGLLNGQTPQLPNGVFDFAKTNTENAFSWQPQNDVRMAMVLDYVQSPTVSYVAVGRSLKEVEIRESDLTKMIFISWVICMGILLIHWATGIFLNKKHAV